LDFQGIPILFSAIRNATEALCNRIASAAEYHHEPALAGSHLFPHIQERKISCLF
tara:strand:- start:467 stop:631 length:165 start_codon:yes stop_codon:yes gene_type:complete